MNSLQLRRELHDKLKELSDTALAVTDMDLTNESARYAKLEALWKIVESMDELHRALSGEPAHNYPEAFGVMK